MQLGAQSLKTGIGPYCPFRGTRDRDSLAKIKTQLGGSLRK